MVGLMVRLVDGLWMVKTCRWLVDGKTRRWYDSWMFEQPALE